MTIKIDGLAVENRDDRHVVYRLADGTRLPLVAPPDLDGSVLSDIGPVADQVRKAADALAAVEAARRAASNDRSLSEIGRGQKVQPAKQAAIQVMAHAQAEMEKLAASAETAQANALAPPKIVAGDMETIFRDQEIRHYARGLDDKALTAYAESLKDNPDHLAAIVRSPVPMGMLSEHARRLWTEKQESTPLGRRVSTFAETVEWGRGTLSQIAARI